MTTERDPVLAALLERERAAQAEDPQVARDTWTRIEGTLTARAAAAPIQGGVRFALVALVVAVFVAGAYVLFSQRPHAGPATRIPPAPSAPPAVPAASPTVELDAGTVQREPVPEVEVAPAPERPEAREPAPSPLAEEVRLLEAARRRLAAGDRAGVLRYVERHAARFPDGVLARERERLRERAQGMEGDTR